MVAICDWGRNSSGGTTVHNSFVYHGELGAAPHYSQLALGRLQDQTPDVRTAFASGTTKEEPTACAAELWKEPSLQSPLHISMGTDTCLSCCRGDTALLSEPGKRSPMHCSILETGAVSHQRLPPHSPPPPIPFLHLLLALRCSVSIPPNNWLWYQHLKWHSQPEHLHVHGLCPPHHCNYSHILSDHAAQQLPLVPICTWSWVAKPAHLSSAFPHFRYF